MSDNTETSPDASPQTPTDTTADVKDTPVADGEQEATQEVSPDQVINDMLAKSPLKFKVNNKEREFKSLAELSKFANLGLASSERFEEASKLKQDAEAKLKEMESITPDQFLKNRFADEDSLYDFLTEFVEKSKEEEALTPEQKELREYKRKEAERLAKAEADAKEAQAKEEQAAVEAETRQLVQELTSEFEKQGIGEDYELYNKVIDEMQVALSQGIDLSVAEAVAYAKQHREADLEGLVQSLTPEAIFSILGKDGLAKLQAEAIKSVKGAEKPFDKAGQQPSDQAGSEKAAGRRVVDLSSKARYKDLFKKKS